MTSARAKLHKIGGVADRRRGSAGIKGRGAGQGYRGAACVKRERALCGQACSGETSTCRRRHCAGAPALPPRPLSAASLGCGRGCRRVGQVVGVVDQPIRGVLFLWHAHLQQSEGGGVRSMRGGGPGRGSMHARICRRSRAAHLAAAIHPPPAIQGLLQVLGLGGGGPVDGCGRGREAGWGRMHDVRRRGVPERCRRRGSSPTAAEAAVSGTFLSTARTRQRPMQGSGGAASGPGGCERLVVGIDPPSALPRACTPIE